MGYESRFELRQREIGVYVKLRSSVCFHLLKMSKTKIRQVFSTYGLVTDVKARTQIMPKQKEILSWTHMVRNGTFEQQGGYTVKQ
jgi:hypothetical protein